MERDVTKLGYTEERNLLFVEHRKASEEVYARYENYETTGLDGELTQEIRKVDMELRRKLRELNEKHGMT